MRFAALRREPFFTLLSILNDMIDEAILAAIPHRPPMLLIEEIVSKTPEEIVCRKTFREDDFFVQGHYPGQPVVPGVILCESALQAGAILVSQHVQSLHGVPVVTRMNDVKFKRMIRPGDTVLIEVRLQEKLADAFFLQAKVSCDGKPAVRLEFACTLAPGS